MKPAVRASLLSAGLEVTEMAMEQELKGGIDVLRDCAKRGAEINPPMRQWFDGYAKACDDIKRAVVDAAFKGRPLPEHWRPNNEHPE